MAISLNARLTLILAVSIPLLAVVIYYRMKKHTAVFLYAAKAR